jgi:hypothetical protein
MAAPPTQAAPLTPETGWRVGEYAGRRPCSTEAYVSIARRAEHADKVAFQSFDHYGHGSVTIPEVAAAFDDLLAWMNGGPKPKSGHSVNQAEPARATPTARPASGAQ